MKLYKPPQIIRLLYPALYRIKTSRNAIYLTFDDGPCEKTTPHILKILRKYNIKATFFCVGDNILKYPDIFEQIKKEGHIVGNHTMHHSNGLYTNTNNYLDEIDECASIIGNNLFRPPHGLITPRQNAILRKKGYKIILWDVITYDWDRKQTEEEILDIIQKKTRKGSIIVMHDSQKAADRTLKVLEKSIIWIKSQGYELKPLVKK